jgi:hypothetical protein
MPQIRRYTRVGDDQFTDLQPLHVQLVDSERTNPGMTDNKPPNRQGANRRMPGECPATAEFIAARIIVDDRS